MKWQSHVTYGPARVRGRTLSVEKRQGYTVEKVEIDNGFDGVIPAFLVIPGAAKKPAPGILKYFDTEAVLGLMAPRPFLALTGDSDPTSPPDGIRILDSKLTRIYSLYGAREKFRSVVYPGVGHTYTPEMKSEMAAWFERWL